MSIYRLQNNQDNFLSSKGRGLTPSLLQGRTQYVLY